MGWKVSTFPPVLATSLSTPDLSPRWSPMKYLSLFSGIGGLDLGLDEAA